MKRVILICSVCVLFAGCIYRFNVKERADFSELEKSRSLKVYTVDGVLFDFTEYEVTDSLLIGHGERKAEIGWLSDSARLPWNRIAYIQGSTSGSMRPMVTAAVIGFFVGQTASELSTDGGMTTREYITRYGYSTGSDDGCPFIYSWDGRKYAVEGGALGTSFGKSLEGTTTLGLIALMPDARSLRIRIANERPETEYLNSVQVHQVTPGPGEEVVFADDGLAWPVRERLTPVVVVTDDGEALTDLLQLKDGRNWNPGNPHAPSYSTVEMTIVDTTRVRRGSLLISCSNTPVAEGAFVELCGFLGDAYWKFLFDLEHDPEMQRIVRYWLQKNALHVDLWDGRAWNPAGYLLERGNSLSLERILRVELPERTGDSVRVRLRLRSDLWKVDAVAFDPTVAQPLERRQLPLLSARTSGGESAGASLAHIDDQRVMLLPPEYIDLTFEVPGGYPKGVYCVDVSGYLHEWKMTSADSSYAWARRWIPDSIRLKIVKLVMSRKDFMVRWVDGGEGA
jgi:hypothetical protein